MAKGALPEGDIGGSPATPVKKKTSASQKAQFSNSSNSKVGGTSNSIAMGKMQKPLMNPNALKIGKKKSKRGR
jgi:hypothetical protein